MITKKGDFMNRRSFFKAALLTVGAVVGYSAVVNAEERRRGAKPAAGGAAGAATLVDPKDSAAKGVSYVHKTTDIKDAKLQTERAGVKFKDQNCANCVFYVKDKETTVGGKKAAPCQMPFAANKVVAAQGWCTSWAKKG